MEYANETKTPFERRPDIDWLRVLAVLLLVPFHTALIFTPYGDSYIRGQSGILFEVFIDLVDWWHMPLLFLISGVGVWYALQFRSGKGFAAERVRRLLVPLFFCTFAIIPIPVYCERVQQGVFQGSLIQFIPHAFAGIYPEGNLSWGHMWFVAYLFVFSMLALPLFLYLKGEGGRHIVSKLGSLVDRPGAIFLLAIPLAVIQALLRARWPGFQNLYDDWANFFYYLTFLTYGYLLCSDARIWRAVYRHRISALVLGSCTAAAILWMDFIGSSPAPGYTLAWTLLMILNSFNAWFWIIAILGFGKKYLSFDNAVLRYSNEAVLPFYVLHHAVVVAIAYNAVKWDIGNILQWTFTTTASVVVTALLYEVFVRRTTVTRFLFGMKAKSPGLAYTESALNVAD